LAANRAFLTVESMNHAKLCSSSEWGEPIREELLPCLTRHVDLGVEMLDLGRRPGAATGWLRHRARRQTTVEISEDVAAALGQRSTGTNVEVVVADATGLSWPDCSFGSLGSFTSLHHVPTPELQDKTLGEAFRLLRPGRTFIGSDSLAGDGLRRFHKADAYNPVDPPRLLERLRALGSKKIRVVVEDDVSFVAQKGERGSPASPPRDRSELAR